MRSECIQAVTAAIGRSLTAQEVKDIEDRLSRHMRQNAQRDPRAALGMPRAERLAEAARTAGEELSAEATKKKQRIALTIIAHDRNSRFVHEGPDQFARIKDLLGFNSRIEGRGNATSAETLSNAIRDNALRQMIGTLEATNPKFFGLLADRQGERDLVRELHGDDTGNPVARDAAKQFHELAETLRQRFNRAGADVGKRSDWGMPHHDSQQMIAKMGKDAYVRTCCRRWTGASTRTRTVRDSTTTQCGRCSNRSG